MSQLSSVTFDRPESGVRAALIEAAAHLIATEGPGRLTLRRLAEAVGTSTMAIYTHFGGMPELRRAVRREGFARLTERLAAVQHTDDPVADLARLCLAYYENATANPDLYRIVFMEQPLDEADAVVGSESFQSLVAGVERCITSGAFTAADPAELATQVWALGHGGLTLQLAGLLSPEQASHTLAGALLQLFTSYGAGRDAAQRALETAFSQPG
jgi:AcrR family transcriptional regulator